MAVAVGTTTIPKERAPRRVPPILTMLLGRVTFGIVTVFIVSVLVFAATRLLPGNAAQAILGRSATPDRVAALSEQLQLDRNPFEQYGSWLSGAVRGDLGTSLLANRPVWDVIARPLGNSGALLVVTAVIGVVLGVLAGVIAAVRRDGWFDRILSTSCLVLTALPEYVVALILILLLATNVAHVFPAVSLIPPGDSLWSHLDLLVLPVATLVVAIFPYIFRMMRASMIEVLESDYVEMALLKGLSTQRVVFTHALPNALGPTIQVTGLNILYLAGGVVVVETMFSFDGIGRALVTAVTNRDLPVLQAIVLVLAAFYVVVNIVTDVLTMLATPRQRTSLL